ncbi:MAG: DUF3800 domain-containing protein [Gammaproteobacteria bacterium]|nr:DUF3800 domain-containing protein [Gammaproteobacteria bacterium]
MIIAIDESGSFVSSPDKNSWCVVSAYVFSERSQSKSYNVLKKLKHKYGLSERQEIKLKNVSERDYFSFLTELSKLGGLLFSVATDSYLNDKSTVINHKKIQVDKIRINIPKMKYDTGKKAISDLADEINSLSPQLYVQLQSQVILMSDLLNRGILYYVQRDPKTLRKYKWRIDQKNITKTTYEHAFEKVASPLLQTKSFHEPMIFLEGEDYSHMEPYLYSDGEVPDYIEEAYGKKLNSGVNIGKIVREDMAFPDSKTNLAIQIADLLAAGVRRCLRSEFSNNQLASHLLGRLMVGNAKEKYPVQFVGFQNHEKVVDKKIAKIIHEMKKASKGILLSA